MGFKPTTLCSLDECSPCTVHVYTCVTCTRTHTHTHTHTHTRTHTVTMTNVQVALKGIETSGYVVASSNKAQVFGQEHQPVFKEGDLVCKKSWLACVDRLQVRVTSSTPNYRVFSVSLSLSLYLSISQRLGRPLRVVEFHGYPSLSSPPPQRRPPHKKSGMYYTTYYSMHSDIHVHCIILYMYMYNIIQCTMYMYIHAG